jgi:hypothetical protein
LPASTTCRAPAVLSAEAVASPCKA